MFEFVFGFSIATGICLMFCGYKEQEAYIKGWRDGWDWGWNRGQEEVALEKFHDFSNGVRGQVKKSNDKT